MRRFRAPLLSIAFLLAFVASSAARADSVDQFTYTANGHTFVWQLPASPTVDASGLGQYFTLFNVQYSEDGGALVSGTFDFFNADPLWGGGFDLNPTGTSDFLVDAFGPQVYIWSEAAPTFVPGTYKFDDWAGDVTTTGTLVISSVPEPSVLLLLGAGFLTLALGCSLRKAMA